MEKTKILLVDDMPLITRSISSIADWAKFGYEIAGIAQDGKRALAIMKENKIDILITDIKMPVMDGIELISEVVNSGMKVKIIVLSAYNEYELVRTAFRLGASDYILKSEVKCDELISICDRLRDDLAADSGDLKEAITGRRNMTAKASDQQTGLVEIYEMKNKFYRKMIWGTPGIVEEEANYYLRKYEDNHLALMLVNVENSIPVLKNIWENDYDLFTFSIINIMEEILNEYKTGDVFSIRSDQYGVLFCLKKHLSHKEFIGQAQSCFHNMKTSLKSTLGLDISAGLSRYMENTGKIQIIFEQSETALKYRFAAGKQKLIYFESIPYKNRKQDLNKNDRVALLRDILKTMNTRKITDAISYLRLKENEINLENVDQVVDIYERYGWIFIKFSREYGIQEECEELALRFFRILSKKGTLDELNQWINNMVELFIKSLNSGNQILNKARHYIYEHYCEDISLTSVAEQLFISRGHLCRIFHKETGETFLDFLNNFRIMKAKDIMERKPGLKGYEVAKMVGYKTTSHFYKIFKKVTGRTPNDYKSRQ